MSNVGNGPSRFQPRLAESVAADIRERILAGEYATGSLLPKQDDLLASYGVSAPSMREALRVLEAEGLIRVRRGKMGGAVVQRPSWSSAAFATGLALQGQSVTVRDVGDAIRILEPMCAADAAAREDRGTTVVPDLRANVAATSEALGDGSAFTGVSRLFHSILADWSQNQTLRLTVRSLVAVWSIQEQAWADRIAEEGRYPDRDAQNSVLRAHEAIIKHVEDGNASEVRRIAEKHLAATQPRVLQYYGDRIVDASSVNAVMGFRTLQ